MLKFDVLKPSLNYLDDFLRRTQQGAIVIIIYQMRRFLKKRKAQRLEEELKEKTPMKKSKKISKTNHEFPSSRPSNLSALSDRSKQVTGQR
jgi:hypothetical protein